MNITNSLTARTLKVSPVGRCGLLEHNKTLLGVWDISFGI